jgi:hypothetical protein
MKNALRVLWLIGLAVLVAQCALARPVRIVGNGDGITTPPPVSKPVPYWTVDAIDQTTKTLTLVKSDGKDSRKVKVTAMTKITIDGQVDKLENVQTGMKAENMMVSAGTLSALALVKVKESDSSNKKNK